MASRSTTVPSLAQMYCCFSREPQSLCSRLNEIAFADCVALKSFTGIATSPKEIVKEPIERAAMGGTFAGSLARHAAEPPITLKTVGRTPSRQSPTKGVGLGVRGVGTLGFARDAVVQRPVARAPSPKPQALDLQHLRQALLRSQRIAPRVSCPFQAWRDVPHGEIHGFSSFQLFPRERHGHWGTWHAAGRIRDVERLAADVHVVVDEDLPRPLHDGPF